MPIIPTVGRVVHFYPPGTDPSKDQPNAAIVAHVHSDTCVNLFVIGGDGTPFACQTLSVKLVQDEEPPAGGNYCCWMPYQKQVAEGKIQPTLHAQPEKEKEDEEPHKKHKKTH